MISPNDVRRTGVAVPVWQERGPDGRLLDIYGRVIGPLLAGYLLFDKAFAYIHLPGSPAYIGEMVLALGVLGVITGTGYLRVPLAHEPVLMLLLVFGLWGVLRTVPNVGTYGLDTIRDAALWYYCIFAFLVVAALARAPDLIDRLLAQLGRFTPVLLLWLPVGILLSTLALDTPTMPFTTISVLNHKAGNAALAALLVLWYIILFPERHSVRFRACWSVMALLATMLAATQNRGGMLAFLVGSVIGLIFCRNRVRLVMQAASATGTVLVLAVALTFVLPVIGEQGRAFSVPQLIENVTSLGSAEKIPGSNLHGTVDGRTELWTRILDKQMDDGLLIVGSGFGPNLAADVGVFDEGKDTLRSPHNSHLDVLARMGLVGLSLWIVLWTCWYWAVIVGIRRLASLSRSTRYRVAVLSIVTVSAIHVSSFFDPQLEGPQIAILFWTLFGVGIVAVTPRAWLSRECVR